MASWKCFEASEDRNYCFVKFKNLKILIFEGFSEVLEEGMTGRVPWPGLDFSSLKRYEGILGKEVQVCK